MFARLLGMMFKTEFGKRLIQRKGLKTLNNFQTFARFERGGFFSETGEKIPLQLPHIDFFELCGFIFPIFVTHKNLL